MSSQEVVDLPELPCADAQERSLHTPGPWIVERTPDHLWVGYPKAWSHKVSEIVARFDVGDGFTDAANARNEANARLIAAAPDHAMIAAALCRGVARWEGWGHGAKGEFCFGGIRHSTKLDDFGVPAMTSGMREALFAAGPPA